jgi:hypothetical protein
VGERAVWVKACGLGRQTRTICRAELISCGTPGTNRARAVMRRPYESVISLNAGMILMFLGFFLYIGGDSETVSVGVMLVGAACAFLGFVLAYLAYRVQSRPRSLR